MTRTLILSTALALLTGTAHAVTLWSPPLAAEQPYGFRCSVTNVGSSPRPVEICMRNAFSGEVVGICRDQIVQPGRGWVPPGFGEDGFYVCEIRVDGAKSSVRAAALVQTTGGSTIAAVPIE